MCHVLFSICLYPFLTLRENLCGGVVFLSPAGEQVWIPGLVPAPASDTRFRMWPGLESMLKQTSMLLVGRWTMKWGSLSTGGETHQFTVCTVSVCLCLCVCVCVCVCVLPLLTRRGRVAHSSWPLAAWLWGAGVVIWTQGGVLKTNVFRARPLDAEAPPTPVIPTRISINILHWGKSTKSNVFNIRLVWIWGNWRWSSVDLRFILVLHLI